MTQPRFGCSQCFDRAMSAEAAWDVLRGLPRVASLVDEPHFVVRIIACPACEQRFVIGFAERIDWSGGEDPQQSFALPISAVEQEALRARGGSVERELEGLAPRPWLESDWPSDSGKTSAWRTGRLMVMRHD